LNPGVEHLAASSAIRALTTTISQPRRKKCPTKFCFSEKMLDHTPGQLVKLLPKKAAR
jgi:hypothetical protein